LTLVMLAYFRGFDYRLWILAMGWIASAVGFALSIPFISLYFHSELGMSMTSIGLFFGLSAVVRAIFQALGGELSDRLGRYYLMVFAQLCRSLVFLVIALAVHNHWGFYAIGGMLIFNSIFGATFQPAANAAVADLVGIEKRTEAYSIVRVAGNFGWALGPAMGGFLADKSYAILFVFSGGMTLISSMIIGVFLRGIKKVRRNEEKFRIQDMLSLKGHELILKYAALLFILYLVVSQFIMPFSLYSVDFMGISKKELGFLRHVF
jgi:MFS family permease